MKPYYEQDGVVIYHGDCLEVLPRIAQPFGLSALPSILLMDPPYTAAGGSTNGRVLEADTQFFACWFSAVAAKIRDAMSLEARGFVFSDWRTITLVSGAFRDNAGGMGRTTAWKSNQAIVWDRESVGMGFPFRNSYEMLAVVSGPDCDWSHLSRNVTTVLRHRYPYGGHEFHGSEKPVALLEKLLLWACLGDVPGRIVLDPFMGSGSTLVAARNQGRPCIGIELEERYCEIAVKRLQQGALPLERCTGD